MLDKDILKQLTEIFGMLDSPVEFHIFATEDEPKGKEMIEFVKDVCSTSPLLSYSTIETGKPVAKFHYFTEANLHKSLSEVFPADMNLILYFSPFSMPMEKVKTFLMKKLASV